MLSVPGFKNLGLGENNATALRDRYKVNTPLLYVVIFKLGFGYLFRRTESGFDIDDFLPTNCDLVLSPPLSAKVS